MKKIIVIGAGFSGISAATCLAAKGYDVTVLEKNDKAGGRANLFETDGFVYDMGPSWYWMPDVFEKYFARFGKKVTDYYELIRLDPSYTVVFGENDFWDIPADLNALGDMLESHEKGAKLQLNRFLQQSAYKYKVGINDLVYKPSRSIFEFTSPSLLIDMLKMDIFMSFYKHIRKYFKHEKILKLMEFPILFLGAVPQNTPALYSLMNYADISLGTWYPKGGMYKVVEGMVKLAEEKGVKFLYHQEVKNINIIDGTVKEVVTVQGTFIADAVVANADYHHVETKLLPPQARSYSDKYWETRVMSPSCLIFYLGLNKKIDNINHHTLFFDQDFAKHAHEIYTEPQWPSQPLFYVSVPSKTDDTVAPEGCENVFILIPIAPGLKDDDQTREKYYNIVMDRFEKLTNQSIREAVIYKRSYALNEFTSDYHSFRGNAYGLANTLLQTAILKPSIKSKKVKNLYYTGQLTVPGPGVPPSLISGQVVAVEIEKDFIPRLK